MLDHVAEDIKRYDDLRQGDALPSEYFNFIFQKRIRMTSMQKRSRFEETFRIFISAYWEAEPALVNVVEVTGAGLSRDGVRQSLQVL